MRKRYFIKDGYTIYFASITLADVVYEFGSGLGFTKHIHRYVVAQDHESAEILLHGHLPVVIKRIDLKPALQQNINAYIQPDTWAGYTEAMDKLETVRHELRRFCYLRNWTEAVNLLDASFALADKDSNFASRLNTLLLSDEPTTIELRDLMEIFGRYGAAGRRESFPFYPHTDAVNGIDSALLHYRRGDIEEILQSEVNAAISNTRGRDIQFIETEVRRCCEGLDWCDAITLLDQAKARAASDAKFAAELEDVMVSERPRSVELRELMEHFGRYGSAGMQATCPYYPHTDAVNRLDTAIHYVRRGFVDKMVEEHQVHLDICSANNQNQ